MSLAAQTEAAQSIATSNGGIAASDLVISGEWASGLIVVRAPDGVPLSPELIVFVAQWVNGEWEVTLETDPAFAQTLAQSTPEIFSADAYAMLLQNTNGGFDPAGDGSALLSLPFASGETQTLTGGPHSCCQSDTTYRAAVDFAGGSGVARAAREGVVWRSSACPNFVRVDHANGWQTGYYHLVQESVSNGQSVTRGQQLGVHSASVGCGGSATGAHVHFSLRRNSVPNSLHNIDVGGWNIAQGSYEYQGCLTRLRDGVRRCQWETVYNDGTIGSGSTSSGQYLGRMNFGVDNFGTLTTQQHIWDYVLPGGIGNYLIDIQRRSGNLVYDVIVKNASGQVMATAVNAVDGRGIVAFEGGTAAAAGTYTVTIIPRSGSNGEYTITLWNNSIPRLFFQWGQSAHSQIRHWQYWFDQSYTYHIRVYRTDGNLEYGYQLVNRQNGQTIRSGSSIRGNAFMAANNSAGWYDLYLNPTNGSSGSYTIYITQGDGNPMEPLITSPTVNSTVSNGFSVQIEPGATNHTGVYDFDLEIDNDPGFSSAEFHQSRDRGGWSQSTTITIPTLPAGRYYVRARQGDRVSRGSDWTPAIGFSIQGSAPQIVINNIVRPVSSTMILGQQMRLRFNVANQSSVPVNGHIQLPFTSNLDSSLTPFGYLYFQPSNLQSIQNQTLLGGTTGTYTAQGRPTYNWNRHGLNYCTTVIDPNESSLNVLWSLFEDHLLEYAAGQLIPGSEWYEAIEFFSDLETLLQDTNALLGLLQVRTSGAFTFTPRVVYTHNGNSYTVNGSPVTMQVNVPQSKIDEFVGGFLTARAGSELIGLALEAPGWSKPIFALLAAQPVIWGCYAVINSNNIDYQTTVVPLTEPLARVRSEIAWDISVDEAPLYLYLEDTHETLSDGWYLVGRRNQEIAGDGRAVTADLGTSLENTLANTRIAFDNLRWMISRDTSGFNYNQLRQAISDAQNELEAEAYLEPNLIQNGDFAQNMSHWGTWDGVQTRIRAQGLEFYRRSNTTSAAVLQYTGAALPIRAALEAQIDFANTSNVRKRVVVILHDSDWSDLQVCSFWLPPRTPSQTYVMTAFTTEAWTNATLSMYAAPADSVGWIQADNIALRHRGTAPTSASVRCADPTLF